MAVDISVVVPVYGCPGALPELHRRLVAVLEGMGKSFEIVLVDDHDPQNSWEGIERLCALDERVVGVRLSRNFGQIRAITAGLDLCQGDWVVVMDCDLQDRPEGIPQLYEKAQEGYDVVFARRVQRKDSGVTKLFASATAPTPCSSNGSASSRRPSTWWATSASRVDRPTASRRSWPWPSS